MAGRILDTLAAACFASLAFPVAVVLTARQLLLDFLAETRRIWSTKK